MDIIIHYDILECIVSKLNLKDTINFLFSSNKIYNVYDKSDENYGQNKIANKIIKEAILFFNIPLPTVSIDGKVPLPTVSIDGKVPLILDGKVPLILDGKVPLPKNVNKHKLSNVLIKLYNVYKNDRYINRVDILIYMIENNIDDSDELFDSFCSKCKYVTPINEKDTPLPYEEALSIDGKVPKFISVVDNRNGKPFYYKEFTRNLISKSDMNYMLICADNNKLDILLKHFHVNTYEITYCIKNLLKNGIFYNQKIKKYIDYIFMKYCSINMTSYNKLYFNTIYANLCKTNEKSLLNYLLFKIHKYKCKNIFNKNLIINIMNNSNKYLIQINI
jgi:hypothetical protein